MSWSPAPRCGFIPSSSSPDASSSLHHTVSWSLPFHPPLPLSSASIPLLLLLLSFPSLLPFLLLPLCFRPPPPPPPPSTQPHLGTAHALLVTLVPVAVVPPLLIILATTHLLPKGDFDSLVLRVSVSSLATPMTTMDVNMATMERVVKKVQPVLGTFDQANYHTERVWATAADGTKVMNNQSINAADTSSSTAIEELPLNPFRVPSPVAPSAPPGPHKPRVPHGPREARRQRPADARRLRLLRGLQRPLLLLRAPLAHRPRLCVCHRPRPRRRRDGPLLVRHGTPPPLPHCLPPLPHCLPPLCNCWQCLLSVDKHSFATPLLG